MTYAQMLGFMSEPDPFIDEDFDESETYLEAFLAEVLLRGTNHETKENA